MKETKKLKVNGEPKKEIDSLGRISSGGRPAIELDETQVYKLAQLWCTHEEIAAHFNVSVDTIDRHFAETIKRGKEEGKASLRRMQWRSAIDGNVTMQIWLGKNILKQRESDLLDSPPKDSQIDKDNNEMSENHRLRILNTELQAKLDNKR
jgi:hypothetical protein